MSSYPQPDAGSPQQLVTPCPTIREASLHKPHSLGIRVAVTSLSWPQRKDLRRARMCGRTWVYSFLFPTRIGPAPCPKILTSVLQEIHVHHLFPASRLVLWLFISCIHTRRGNISFNYSIIAMRSFVVHLPYPKTH